MSNSSGAIIALNVSLRIFVKPGFDVDKVAALINEHFGHGEAIVGSGYEPALAAQLQNSILNDIRSSSEEAALIAQNAISEIDLWRDVQTDEDTKPAYEVEPLPSEDRDLADDDLFECVRCHTITDIENSHETEDGLVCDACATPDE